MTARVLLYSDDPIHSLPIVYRNMSLKVLIVCHMVNDWIGPWEILLCKAGQGFAPTAKNFNFHILSYYYLFSFIPMKSVKNNNMRILNANIMNGSFRTLSFFSEEGQRCGVAVPGRYYPSLCLPDLK